MDRGAWQATVNGIPRVGPDLTLSFFLLFKSIKQNLFSKLIFYVQN